jgi:hypothetical protein
VPEEFQILDPGRRRFEMLHQSRPKKIQFIFNCTSMGGAMFETEMSGMEVYSDHGVSGFLLNIGTYQERYKA